MALTPPTVKPTVFQEYIGYQPYPANLTDLPDIVNPWIKEFNFIIAFASEEYDESSGRRKGTGKFYKNWTLPPVDGEMIRKMKKKCENVKVLLSIGGYDQKYPFNPAEKGVWVQNALASLIKIINDLKDSSGRNMIDGIDIDYPTIPSTVDVDVFVTCIGRLIQSLKKELPSIKVISVTPWVRLQPYYQALFKAYETDIDWVNYQFYSQFIGSTEEFLELYTRLATEAYPGNKLLAGFSTDLGEVDQKLLAGFLNVDLGDVDQNLLARFSTDPGAVLARFRTDAGQVVKLTRKVFLEACKILIEKGKLPGMFIWNGNESANNINPFQMERYAQELFPQN